LRQSEDGSIEDGAEIGIGSRFGRREGTVQANLNPAQPAAIGALNSFTATCRHLVQPGSEVRVPWQPIRTADEDKESGLEGIFRVGWIR
jgi:hypothetical protein